MSVMTNVRDSDVRKLCLAAIKAGFEFVTGNNHVHLRRGHRKLVVPTNRSVGPHNVRNFRASLRREGVDV